MATSRRRFLATAAVAAAGVGLTGARRALFAADDASMAASTAGKRLLILGGTKFLGPELVAAAQARGWTLTLFNRGKTNPGMFPDIEKLHGDRAGDLKSLEGRRWDAVVDTSGYVPRHVRLSASLLAPAVAHYVFISTISVYPDTSKPVVDEKSPVTVLKDPADEKVTNESYGGLKALCEEAAEKAMPGRVTNIRPGLIVGPNDPTDRFTYWPVRLAAGGEVLAPGTPSDPVQFIDVRDLAEWTIATLESRTFGVFNAVGPKERTGIGTLLESCRKVAENDARLTWADAKFLAAQNVAPWGDMPVWIPPGEEGAALADVSIKKALAAGLKFRPLEDTVRDTLAWWKGRPEKERAKLRSGIAREREAEVLKAWHARAVAK